MGSGKTTVGRLIAAELGWEFLDTDEVIVARHGPIEAIFAELGESAFRDLEREVAAEVAAGEHQVIATGGRMLLDPANAVALGATGRIFCLAVDAGEITTRLLADTEGPVRPLLGGPDPATVVARLLTERSEGYGRFEQIPTNSREPSDIAADIIGRLDTSPTPSQR